MRIRLPGLFIVLGLVLAGLIHIVAVLALPSLAPKNGFSRFAAARPVNTVIQIRRQRRAAAHADDGARCPLRLLPLRSFERSGAGQREDRRRASSHCALYAGGGEFLFGRRRRRRSGRRSSSSLSPPTSRSKRRAVDLPESVDNVIVVNSPVSEGIALLRLPLAGPSRADSAEQALKATSCGPYTRSG